MTSEPAVEFSFRDPGGRLYRDNGRLLRALKPEAARELREFQQSVPGEKLFARGTVIDTVWRESGVSAAWEGAQFVEHRPIRFPTYPYEWSPEMLWDAARLTLDICGALFPEGWGLKDATPFNILFEGPRPVFVDVLSFERRNPGDSRWLPYAQFVRTFLLPLALNKYSGVSLAAVFLASREGLEPEQAYRLLPFWRRFTPPMLGLASIPTWLSRRSERAAGLYQPPQPVEPAKASYILGRTLGNLSSALDAVKPSLVRSAWTAYAVEEHDSAYVQAKDQAVRRILERERPAMLLDAGCNTGRYSIAAAQAGAEVVALDSDPAVIGRLWTLARHRNLKIQPLAANLARPSPALGWRHRETSSLLDRLAGQFDGVLMLALLHHLMVTEGIPLEEILDLAATLTRRLLVLEFVAPEDEHFRRLARGRDHLYRNLTRESFEASCRRHFDVQETVPLKPGRRWVYCLLRKR
jgi:SAM-dependent methyltransferase